ncbi:acetate--CoA ligase family protein [Rhodobacter sp. NTK016B]|uniref:acetate--CoA ligase family protein n=1 Tax=Rhodobacter sp. NTK016B TaxID=2759676 RepID=UPI001A90B952|nr:acetate--CoA ligase family protein [Rhodobacter sp. NTK016B]MBN8291831.1 acetate--CoA ligase family protein [Rhodobacter sp. NTK016B]
MPDDRRDARAIDTLFHPRAIAIVGASDKPGSVGRDVVENLLEKGYDGAIYPVNPRLDTLMGLKTYPSLEALPGQADLVAIAVPAPATAAVLRQAGHLGIPNAIIYASGFAEAGPEGTALQDDLAAAVRETGLRVIGPNCQGLMNIAEGIHIGFGPPYKLDYVKGSVGVVSQSGAFGNSLLMGLSSEKVGVSGYISTGNEVGTTALDMAEAMLEDPETTVIAGYIEGLRDAGRLPEVAVRAQELGKPLVLWKVGRSKAGAKAAASHTASLAGDDTLYRAAFRQYGIVDVDDIGEMADCVRALTTGRAAKGPRVGVVTVSGGAGVAMADRAEALGLELGQFTPETVTALRAVLPKFASFANPLDVTANAVMDPAALARTLELVAADPGVDMLALTFAGASGRAGASIAEAVSAIHAATDLPIVISWNAPRDRNAEAYARLEEVGVPVYATPARAIRGLAAIWTARQSRALAAPGPRPSAQPARLLNEVDSKRWLTGTGVSAPAESVAQSRDEAVTAAGEIGYPVVAKLLSGQLDHKSDLGGVKVNLIDAAAVAEAFDALRAIPGPLDLPFEGALVQRMISGGVEMILGARVDPSFGPIIMVGGGGIFAEVFEDVALRLAPVTEAEAREMINETRIARILRGIRGKEPHDIDALARAIAGLSRRIAEPDGILQEIEINPVFVMEPGGGVIAGDCVTRVAEGAKSTH